MKQLFVRFYLGVLAVLFLAWFIHGYVIMNRAGAERDRVMSLAHRGGARLVAKELNACRSASKDAVLAKLQKRFAYPVQIKPWSELDSKHQSALKVPGTVILTRLPQGGDAVITELKSEETYLQLGPFPDYHLLGIEDSIGGWVQVAAQKIEGATDQESALAELAPQFDFPVVMMTRDELPSHAIKRMDEGRDVVFYSAENMRFWAAYQMKEQDKVLRFGPFPGFDRIDKMAATTTLALVLLPAAIAIALLLRPVARQLRQVENAARQIAAGQLNARVNEQRIGSAKPLAQAFNHMAIRTETLVRTQRELLQAVSHELRTPLSRIRFAIDLIGTANSDEERQLRLDALDGASEELDDLVAELLRYVTLENATTEIQREPLAVTEIVKQLIPKYQELYPAIQFSISPDTHSDLTVQAERLGFQRVLGNLLSNAARHAKQAVIVSAQVHSDGIEIHVDDDGCGIPESARERVFEPFVRLESEPLTSPNGVGLGLAIVKRIMVQHRGQVSISSNVAGGCRITTLWPRSADLTAADE